MSIQLSFNEELKYDDNTAGITIFVSLGYAGKNLRVEAKVDPGAEVCLFTHDVAQRLGIAVESGIPICQISKPDAKHPGAARLVEKTETCRDLLRQPALPQRVFFVTATDFTA